MSLGVPAVASSSFSELEEAPARRSHDAARASRTSTAGRWSTSTRGCANGTTPPSGRTSRPRTPTPTRCSHRSRRCQRLYTEMLAPHPGDRRERPLPQGRLLLLLPHRAGQAVPDPLPQARVARGRGAGHSRPQRARPRPVCRPGRLRGERRRGAARLLDRRRRLAPLHALRARPRERAGARAGGRGSRRRGLGGRRADARLHHRGAGHTAAVPALPPHSGQRQPRSRLRGSGPGFQPVRLSHAQPGLPRARRGQPDDLGRTLHPGRAARGALAARRAAGAPAGVRASSTTASALLHPHERRRPQLPAGPHGTVDEPGPRELGRGGSLIARR